MNWYADLRLTNAASHAVYLGVAFESHDMLGATTQYVAWRNAVHTFTQLNVSLDMMTARRPKGRKYISIADTVAVRQALFEFAFEPPKEKDSE